MSGASAQSGNSKSKWAMSPANMATKTKYLASYIEKSHYKDSASVWLNRPIFDYGITHYPPCLRSDRTNRILLYPGSFNPPHHGHLELLQHGFARSGYDIIAAIVIPLDDERLDRKCRAQGENLMFSKKQRVELWRGKYWPSDWFWVYDHTEQEWTEFRRLLTKNITDDGFDLSFVLLCGPDYVQLRELPSPMSWDCKDIIVSNVGRPADFISSAGLVTLENCEPWEKAALKRDIIQRDALEKVAWFYSGLSLLSCRPQALQTMLNEGKYNLRSYRVRVTVGKLDPGQIERLLDEIYEESVANTHIIRVCNRTDAPGSTIRFVPRKGKQLNTSSTLIRNIVRTCSADELSRRLSGVALNLEVLAQFLV